jgi:hypothetical protein
MDFIIERLKEPSTYAGFSTIAVAVGVSQPLYTAVAAVVAGVFGVIAVLKSEGKLKF